MSRRRSTKPFRPSVESLEERTLMTTGLTDPNRIVVPAPLPLPAVGSTFTDPTFGTSLRRVSGVSERGGFESQIYSQLQAFSADSAHMLLTGSDGYVVRRSSDFARVGGFDTSNWNVPRWHPTQAHTLVHFDGNDDNDLTLQFTDIRTGVTRDVFTFPATYWTILGNQSFDELSRDGRWLAGMANRFDGERVLFTLDLVNRRLAVELPLSVIYTTHARPDPEWGQIEPDWVGVSPLGNTMVVQWKRDGTAGASGLETFDIQTGAFRGRVMEGHQHGDMNVLADGRTEVFMTFDFTHPSGDQWLAYRALPGTATVSPPVFVRPLAWFTAAHISGQGPNGTFLVTASNSPGDRQTPFEGEVFLLHTDGRVERLVHHRSTESRYFAQPRATISADGRFVLFASDWGRTGGGGDGGRADPYLLTLNSDSPMNREPILQAVEDVSVTAGQSIAFTARASDPDGDALTFSLAPGAPQGATIHSSRGAFTWTPTATGTFNFSVRVTDQGTPPRSAERTFRVTVRPQGVEPQPWTLDLNTLPVGNNRVMDSITIEGIGDNVVVSLNGRVLLQSPPTSLTLIRILGSNDRDEVLVAGNGLSVPVRIDGRGGDDRFTVREGTGANVVLEGGTGRDTLVGPNQVNTWRITATNAGRLGAIAFTNVENLTGGRLADHFLLSSNIGVAGILDGQGGVDTLDYSAYAQVARVSVNLARGTATRIGLVREIENVVGGAGADIILGNRFDNVLRGGGGNDILRGYEGNDILIGDQGRDHLDGGGGRDLLIGGSDADTQLGGAGEDLLIAGTTAHDTNLDALLTLLAEWRRTNLPGTTRERFDLRAARLRSGVGTDSAVRLVEGATVFDDGIVDRLTGGADLDLFYGQISDITDLN